ncbi:MAG TPA: hypothetical protein VEJ18_22175, partial [Planctomycetota bacterium]|nr:hypothetical protein [Planctomycetota bacterium]
MRELLLRHRLVTPAQLEDAEALRQVQGRSGARPRLVDVLVRQGVLPGADVVRTLSAPAAPLPQPFPPETAPPSLWAPLPPDVEAAAADPARRFGKYVLVKEAGRGATATVWRAWDRALSQSVALKILSPRSVGGCDTG